MAEAHGCAHCQKQGDLKRCSICKVAHYCNITCQKSDLKRHRQEDRCGAVSTPSKARSTAEPATVSSHSSASPTTSSVQKNVTEDTSRPTSSITPPAKRGLDVDSTPRCLRCRSAAGEASEHRYVDIVCRSIFEPQCAHGPFCDTCIQKLQRQTLAFCSCRALIRTCERMGCKVSQSLPGPGKELLQDAVSVAMPTSAVNSTSRLEALD